MIIWTVSDAGNGQSGSGDGCVDVYCPSQKIAKRVKKRLEKELGCKCLILKHDISKHNKGSRTNLVFSALEAMRDSSGYENLWRMEEDEPAKKKTDSQNDPYTSEGPESLKSLLRF